MFDLANLASCSDLTSEHAKQASSSSTEMRTLLKRVAEIAKPNEGCPKVLMALARLVGKEWVDGDLRVELSGDDKSTQLIIITEHGIGIRERLLPMARFNVPIDEFERALELAPHLVLPLRITDEPGKLVLTPLATPEANVSSATPVAVVAVDPTSLGDGERETSPPPADELQVVDEASPIDLAQAFLADVMSTAPPPNGTPAALTADEPDAEPQAGRMESGRVPTGDPHDAHEDRISNVHTRPTVRRMVAVDAAAVAAAAAKRRDPRREEE